MYVMAQTHWKILHFQSWNSTNDIARDYYRHASSNIYCNFYVDYVSSLSSFVILFVVNLKGNLNMLRLVSLDGVFVSNICPTISYVG
jgi:hypothetical protein